eukprot:TRINITY_DN17177_c0_g1_i1.p1 TRINITY_DN17177_c0_g1~~TRINITY_DN17177_c0_g1_i1.p1  ORF type:complete len:253 (+),score=70.90 TRINITY_DN17177_c0_g1_i1:76-834(+)
MGGKASKARREAKRAALQAGLEPPKEPAAPPVQAKASDEPKGLSKKQERERRKRQAKRELAQKEQDLKELTSKKEALRAAGESLQPKKQKAPVAANDGAKAEDRRVVFVGRLSTTMKSAALKKHFKDGGVSGPVRVKVLKDAETWEPRGMAFVEVSNEENMLKALELNESSFEDAKISVERSNVKLTRATSSAENESAEDAAPAKKTTKKKKVKAGAAKETTDESGKKKRKAKPVEASVKKQRVEFSDSDAE